MLRLLVSALLIVSANCCFPTVPPPLPPSPPPITRDMCQSALAPAIDIPAGTETACIDEQPGLATIVASLSENVAANGVSVALATNGHPDKAVILRMCLAREIGLVDINGAFDMAKLKGILQAAASGEVFETNTQKGLDNCSPVVEDVRFDAYVVCVVHYCYAGGPLGK